MGIEVEWYKGRQDIIRYIYDGPWTWDDLWKATEKGNKMMDSVHPKTVHLFVDLSKSSILPNRPWDMGQKLNNEARSNEGTRVMIGANTFITMAVKLFEGSGKSGKAPKTAVAANLQEAEKLIASYSPSSH